MSRFHRALLASASFATLATAAQAQSLQISPPPPPGVTQTIPDQWSYYAPWGSNDPTLLTSNIAGAFTGGTGPASSEVFQIASNTLNQFGAAGSAVVVVGDLPITQNYTFGNLQDISVLNSNGAYSASGMSTASGSQVASTAINGVAVDVAVNNGKGGDTFGAATNGNTLSISQNYQPGSHEYYNWWDGWYPVTGQQNITQQNSITAGYDTNAGTVGTGGAAIEGVKLPTSTGTSVAGLQANSVSINTASVNLVPQAAEAANIPLTVDNGKGGSGFENVKIDQYAQLNTSITLFNVADAGTQNPSTPIYPGRPPVDPSIANLQQIASVTINSATLTSTGGFDPSTPPTVNLQPAFATNSPYSQVPNQTFTTYSDNGKGGETFGGANITLFNVADALTWSRGAYTGPGSTWNPSVAGNGNVEIGGANADTGGVKQIVALSINSVSGATSQNGQPAQQVNINAGMVNSNFPSWTYPTGTSPFSQFADLSNLSLQGRPDGNPVPDTAGGAGISTSDFVENLVNTAYFPSYEGSSPIPVPPDHFDWSDAQNTAIAGTNIGNATIQNTDQVTALTVNSFSFDNSAKDSAGNIVAGSTNTDTVSGAISQVAILGAGWESWGTKTFSLANVAAAVTNSGTATLDNVTQTNVFSANSFTAGAADFTGSPFPDPTNPVSTIGTGYLSQTADTNGLILNLGNLAVAKGTTATIADTKQVNMVALNTGTIGTLTAGGGGIGQTLYGGVNVNAGNYLQAVGTATASISNAQQVNVVSVNSITGYAH